MIWKPSLIARRPIADSESKGLVLDLPMLEGGGNMVHDYSGNGNDGTFVGDTHFVSTERGPALDFDGTGDYAGIQYNNSLSFSDTNQLTISLTAISNSTHAGGLIGNSPLNSALESYAMFNLSGVFWGRVNNSDDTNHTVSGGTWENGVPYCIVMTCGNSVLRLYVDGIEIDNVAFSGIIKNLDSAIHIGERGDIWVGSPFHWYFDGQISDVRIYNRALTAGEVQQLL